jgi:hypothetical protein
MKAATLKILLAWVAVLLVCYGLLEVFFLYYVASIFPLASLGGAGSGSYLLVQYSKNHVFPKNYIAIFGDSYSYGQGDWMLEHAHDIKPTYSPSQLLYKELGRDVISFGLPASDNIRSNNVLPSTWLAYARAANTEKIEDPSEIIVYFYEGNDLNDNVEVYQKKISPGLSPDENFYDSSVAQRKIKQLIESDTTYQDYKKTSFFDRCFFAIFSKALAVNFFQEEILGQKQAPWKPTQPGKIGKIEIGHREEFLPNKMQTPALALDKQEIDLGLYMFKQSVVYLKAQFPKAKVGIAYIPSVSTPYAYTSEYIHDYYNDTQSVNGHIQPVSKIRPNSDYICNRVRDVAIELQTGFVDPRAHLRSVARNNYIHGPIDWHHFNQLGYETFTEDLLVLLKQMEMEKYQPLPKCSWQ